jgi:phospholipid transport system substrate-binding protein
MEWNQLGKCPYRKEIVAMKTLRLSVLATTLGLCLAAQVWAGAPIDQARQNTDQIIKVLGDPALNEAERRTAVRKVAEQMFDMSEAAKRALGRHWQSRTPAEREEFIRLFADFLENTYLSKLVLYSGERVNYVSESIDGDLASVRAKILRKQGPEVPVEARMLRRGDRWYVYDISVEGISMISNYRSQFNTIIQKSSYEQLVQRLRATREVSLNDR